MTLIREGSFKELWKVSSSLMVSFLSMFGMMFIDRIFLARLSPEALNAAASSGTLFWATSLGWVTLASMAEVFVAQYNGAKKFNRLGEPVWQMIWLSLFSIFFFVFAAFGGSLFLQSSGIFNTQEAIYFKWNCLFGPAFTALAAASAFFIGQGKTAIIKWLALLGNSINVILDPLFIFGIDGWFPAFGIAGAAVATGLGILIQVLILGWVMLRQKNREQYGSSKWRFQKAMFKRNIKIGLPPALFVSFELLGWAIFYWMMARVSEVHILVASVCQSILLLFLFFGMALEKGAAAVAGNLIGAGQAHKVKRVFMNGLKLTGLYAFVLAFFFAAYPNLLLDWFFQNPDVLASGEFSAPSSGTMNLSVLKGLIQSGLILVAVYITIENVRWLLSGILTSAGDTLFLMLAGVISIWSFMIVPTYFLIIKKGMGPIAAFWIWIFYSILATLLNYFRFLYGKWKEKHIIEETNQSQKESVTEEAF